jgi:hypothetical protein
MNSPTPPEDVNALRDRLRALGYLDARVDRFVLSGAAPDTRPFRLALSAAWRIGVLSGVLLGPAAAVGLATRAPGLVTGITDALVVAAYLMLPFGLASTLLALVTITVAGRVGHRGAAVAAGLLASGACLVYLTLWWRAAVPTEAVGSQVFALAVAAAISLLIGHAITVSTLAVFVQRGLAQLPTGSPLSSWRVLVPVGGVALGGALFLLHSLTPSAADTPTVPLTVVPTGQHVIVIGIDGLDVPTVDRLRRDAGTLPTFDRLLSGVVAPLAVDDVQDPARAWTTLATGQPPETHGIESLEARQVAGLDGRMGSTTPGVSLLTTATDLLRLTRPAITTGDQRHAPAFWEVAATAGLRTTVVHWWATWPAGQTSGNVLTDRAILRLEQGGPLAAEIAPASLYDGLRASAADRQRGVDAMVSNIASDAPPDVAAVIERSARLDATILALAIDPALERQDLLAVYLPGLDIAQHALFDSTSQGTLAPAAAAARVRALESYYRFLDRALTQTLLSDAPEAVVTMLIGQPGRVSDPGPGLLAVAGSVAASRSLATVSPHVIAPTILRGLGAPVASDLPAQALEEVWIESFRETYPRRTVPTWGQRRGAPSPAAGRSLDREMIERMRSLGYVR